MNETDLDPTPRYIKGHWPEATRLLEEAIRAPGIDKGDPIPLPRLLSALLTVTDLALKKGYDDVRVSLMLDSYDEEATASVYCSRMETTNETASRVQLAKQLAEYRRLSDERFKAERRKEYERLKAEFENNE